MGIKELKLDLLLPLISYVLPLPFFISKHAINVECKPPIIKNNKKPNGFLISLVGAEKS